MKQKPSKERGPLTQKICVRVSPEMKMFFTHQANASETIDKLIRESKAFREWKQKVGKFNL